MSPERLTNDTAHKQHRHEPRRTVCSTRDRLRGPSEHSARQGNEEMPDGLGGKRPAARSQARRRGPRQGDTRTSASLASTRAPGLLEGLITTLHVGRSAEPVT